MDINYSTVIDNFLNNKQLVSSVYYRIFLILIGISLIPNRDKEYITTQEILNKYQTAITDVDGLTIADVPDYAENNHWMILLQIDKKTYGEDREELMQRLDANNIQTRPAWDPIYLQKPYRDCQSYKVERAEALVDNSLCLPSSTNLSNQDLNKVIDILNG